MHVKLLLRAKARGLGLLLGTLVLPAVLLDCGQAAGIYQTGFWYGLGENTSDAVFSAAALEAAHEYDGPVLVPNAPSSSATPLKREVPDTWVVPPL